jgi:hypothetical protein
VRKAALDMLALLGLAAFLYGVWLIYRPAAFIVGGGVTVAVALLLARVRSEP